jgi:predicted DNA-binding protein (MmcQ/YjbR family)
MRTLREQLLWYAKKTYGTDPDFPWQATPENWVLRHADSRKWYALMMNIPAEKLGMTGGGRVDVLNLKADPRMIGSLRQEQGIYPAYHMRNKDWITIVLDGSVPRGEIESLIDMSYELTDTPRGRGRGGLRNTEWIVPANPRYYDVEAAIRESPDGVFIWKQSNRIAVGDTVYLYLAAPVSAIRYRCRAIETDIPFEFSDGNVRMRRVMRLQLLARYDGTPVSFAMLREYGVNAVRGPRGMPPALKAAIERLYRT